MTDTPNGHKATPEQWRDQEIWGNPWGNPENDGDSDSSCILELRDTLAALEQRVQEAEKRGADAEYSACHTWLDINGCPSRFIDGLREARRPTPPTLREQALKALRERLDNPMVVHLPENRDAMELALQALQETSNA
jgi:hypothetical protein